MKKLKHRLLVIGSGAMGHSIALQAALSGIEVCLVGMTPAELATARQEIGMKLITLARHGMIHDTEAAEKLITTSIDVEEAVTKADVVIEAVPEILSLKIDLFRKLDSICSKEVILASSTSGLLPSAISAKMQHPERFIVAHFWNPAHLIPLVEVVGGNATSPDTIAFIFEFLQSMGKKPVLVKKEIPGFIGNRLQLALLREAQYLLQEGVASREDIDASVRYGIGRRLPETGPLESADLGGLDVFSAIFSYLHLCNQEGPMPILQELVSQQHFGAKTGQGFYTWDNHRKRQMNENRERTLIEFMRKDRETGNTGS